MATNIYLLDGMVYLVDTHYVDKRCHFLDNLGNLLESAYDNRDFLNPADLPGTAVRLPLNGLKLYDAIVSTYGKEDG